MHLKTTCKFECHKGQPTGLRILYVLDLLFKNAIILMILFLLAAYESGLPPVFLVRITAGKKPLRVTKSELYK